MGKEISMKSLLGVMIFAIIAIGGFVAYTQYKPTGGSVVTYVTTPGGGVLPTDGATVYAGCPDDGDTSLKIDVKNSANETGSEEFDVTGYLYKKTGSAIEYVTSITDTTSPTASTIDCGADYVFKAISVDGASGDSSTFKKVLSGDSDVRIVDGFLEFTTSNSNENIIVGMDQHATLKCRAYDNIQKGLMYDLSDATATDYETDGITFESTTNNATASDETLGLDIEFQCLAVQTDTNYNDRGIYVLLESPAATWASTPAVYANGNKLTEMKAQLSPNEAVAYAGYEYVYLIPSSIEIKDGGDGLNLRVVENLAGGVASASANPEVDLAVRGTVLSTDGVSVVTGSVGDDSSKTTIYAVFDMAINMTG